MRLDGGVDEEGTVAAWTLFKGTGTGKTCGDEMELLHGMKGDPGVLMAPLFGVWRLV
jgi:hypothetical protein